MEFVKSFIPDQEDSKFFNYTREKRVNRAIFRVGIDLKRFKRYK